MTPPELRESLPSRMAALKISQMDLCRLVEWSQAQMSGFLAGKRNGIRIDKLNRLHILVSELEQLATQFAPVPVDFRDTAAIRALLASQRKPASERTVKRKQEVETPTIEQQQEVKRIWPELTAGK
jgi:predicted transcriptional regulator